MDIAGDGVRLPGGLVKHGADDPDTELPRRKVVIEHKNGKLFGFACKKFRLVFELCCHNA